MKRYIMGLMTAIVCLSVSCHREMTDDSKGYLYLNVDNDSAEEVIVKAPEPVTTPYIVEIYNSSGLIHKFDDHTTLTADSPLELLIGTYTVKAMNRDFANESFQEYFAAERQVRILPDQTLSFDMTCVRKDVRLSVEFPVEFSELFKKYEVRVTNGRGNELVLSNSPDPDDPCQASLSDIASFDVTGQLSWSLYLKNMDSADDNDKGGIYISETKTYTGVKAGDHYHLTFDLAEPEEIDGVFALRVVVNGETIEVLHDVQIDFEQEGKPTFTTNEGFDVPTQAGEYMTVIFEDPSDKYITFSTPAGLKHLYVSHYDDDLSAVGLPQLTDLHKGTQSEKDVLTVLGIAHNIGANTSVVNLTNFIKILPQGIYDFTVTAIDNKGRYAKCHLPIEIVLDVDAEAFGATPWGQFAFVEGRYFVDPAPEGLTFQYRHSLDTEWETLSTSAIELNPSIMRFTGRIDGLEPESEYVFRAVSAKDMQDGKESKELRFTTESADQLYNLNFDHWCKAKAGSSISTAQVWYPNDDLSQHYIWDSANASGMTNTTEPVDDVAVVKENGKAAKLTSLDAIKFAAGNIFTGQFSKVDMASMGAELNWGVEFESRPIAMKGYFKYSPAEIQNAGGTKYSDQQGKTDQCQILVCLTNWNKPFPVSTGANEFVDFENDEGIIAFGVKYANEKSDTYQPFLIPIEYREGMTDVIPSYIIVACASSRYGDYFVGGVGSTMYVDEFELIYDPAELSPEEFDKVFPKSN